MSGANLIQKKIRALGSKQKAKGAQRFFKTGPGEYGEGDVFLGVSVPQARSVAQEHKMASELEIKQLLASKYHEERLVGLIILVGKFQSGTPLEQRRVVRVYLSERQAINNWDLVDVSCYKILGQWCFQNQDTKTLARLVTSRRHWDRRMGIVATYAYIRQSQTQLTLRLAVPLLRDPEDLMHKATGWMLRESGKRDLRALRLFLQRFAGQMPRTMLRYAIERMSPSERKKWLAVKQPRRVN